MDILSIVLQSLLILAFFFAAAGKVMGTRMHVDNFNHWRLPQWFRIITGALENVGVAALIIGFWEPSWLAAGALLLSVISIGGILTHARAKDSFKQTSSIIFLGILAVVLFVLKYPDLYNFPGFN
jgi:putative oxidoreductase